MRILDEFDSRCAPPHRSDRSAPDDSSNLLPSLPFVHRAGAWPLAAERGNSCVCLCGVCESFRRARAAKTGLEMESGNDITGVRFC